MSRRLKRFLCAAVLCALASTPALAKASDVDVRVAAISRAIGEQRLVDAGRMLDQAMLQNLRDSRLDVLTGELHLLRARPAEALDSFNRAAAGGADPAAAQGAGIALSMLGRPDEAMAQLLNAARLDPSAWRAWNALGVEHDRRKDWTAAEEAYRLALDAADEDAAILNNRGYSRMLQGRLDEAVVDLVAALEQRPTLGAARTNLRLAMAMRGEYSQAVAGGSTDDQAALLNNAGFAAVTRGDYATATDLFEQALRAKNGDYERASNNAAYVRSLASRQP